MQTNTFTFQDNIYILGRVSACNFDTGNDDNFVLSSVDSLTNYVSNYQKYLSHKIMWMETSLGDGLATHIMREMH